VLRLAGATAASDDGVLRASDPTRSKNFNVKVHRAVLDAARVVVVERDADRERGKEVTDTGTVGGGYAVTQ